MSKQTARIDDLVIQQGATFREVFARVNYPYLTRIAADGRTVLKEDGTPAPDEDAALEDYTGCTGVLKLYDQAGALVKTLDNGVNGGLVFGGNTVQLHISDEDTELMNFVKLEGDVNVTKPNGDTERHWELVIAFSPKAPRGGLA